MLITGAWKIFGGGSGGKHDGQGAAREPDGCGCLAYALFETAFWILAFVLSMCSHGHAN